MVRHRVHTFIVKNAIHPELRLWRTTSQKFSSSPSSSSKSEISSNAQASDVESCLNHTPGSSSSIQKNEAGNPTSTEFPLRPPLERLYHLWYESSGTAEISSLKDEVAKASKEFDVATREVTESRRDVDKKLLAYEEVHGQHASMLRVRDKWDGTDAAAFAELVGKEVHTRKELESARVQLQKAESNVANWQIVYMVRIPLL